MPELRKDPIIKRWVIIATERAKRPNDFKPSAPQFTKEEPCPFCEKKGKSNFTEILTRKENNTQPDKPGWKVKVVTGDSPVLHSEGDLDKKPHGIYDMMDGIGAHEIVIETPEHIASMDSLKPEQIEEVLGVYKERILDLERDERFKYVLVFKNHKTAAGSSSVMHSRSQLIALPACPKNVKGELEGAKRYYDYKDRCVYCDMLAQEEKEKKRVILDAGGFVAIAPFASRFPFETWILPRKHAAYFSKISSKEIKGVAKMLKEILTRRNNLLSDVAYNYILHTAPFRRPKPGYWSTIDCDYHWHIEIIPRLTQVAGFEWGTGFYINPMPPEDAAKFLREGKE